MGQQSIRQEARRAALDAQSKRRRERAEREKQLGGLAFTVLVAVRERDAAVADTERRAGQALREMTEDKGLSVREAVEWCGDEITTREATRLRRLAEADSSSAEPFGIRVESPNLHSSRFGPRPGQIRRPESRLSC